MPAALAAIARQLIIMLVQTAAFAALQSLFQKIIDKSNKNNVDEYGLSEEDANSHTANAILDIALVAGVTLLSLKTKLPVKIADKLGFTTKGFKKRSLSTAGEAKLKAKGVKPVVTTAATTEVIEEAATTIAATKGVAKSTAKGVFDVMFKVGGLTVGVGLLVTNVMDFGAWPSSAYQSTVQKFLSKFGLDADKDASQPKSISPDLFNKLLAAMQAEGITHFKDPYSLEVVPLTRDNLIKTADKVAGQINFEKGKTTFKDLIAVFVPLSIKGSAGNSNIVYTKPAATTGGGTSTGQSVGVQVPTKVFTGVVSQGVVGQGLAFEARPDDLIESLEEMKTAAANNLAPYLQALPSRVTYELKVVSSITTKDGFKQSGTTQRIQTGTYKNGTPKYKTVTNKFAVLDVFILNNKNTRTKLTTIVLGPTDSVKLSVAQTDLRNLESVLSSVVTTTDINDIIGIQTNQGLVDLMPKTTTDEVALPVVDDNEDTGFRFYSFTVNGEEYLDIIPWLGNIPTGYEPLTRSEFLRRQDQKLKNNPTRWDAYFKDLYRRNPTAFTTGKSGYVIRDGIPYLIQDVSGSGTAPAVGGSGSMSGNAGASATTLPEWYQARGLALPSISTRATKYQELGLGQFFYYTGTAEQNTKLLNALKNT